MARATTEVKVEAVDNGFIITFDEMYLEHREIHQDLDEVYARLEELLEDDGEDD